MGAVTVRLLQARPNGQVIHNVCRVRNHRDMTVDINHHRRSQEVRQATSPTAARGRDVTDTDELAADYTALEAATGAVVLARQRLRAMRCARMLRRAGKADVVRAKRSLAAARAELNACRAGIGWWVRRPKRRLRRLSPNAGRTDMLRLRGAATTTVARVVAVAYMLTIALVLLVAQWPMRGPQLLGPGGHGPHVGDLLVLAATATAAVAVLRAES